MTDPKFVGCNGAAAGAGVHQGVQTGVDVEVAVGPIGR